MAAAALEGGEVARLHKAADHYGRLLRQPETLTRKLGSWQEQGKVPAR
jgi:hypothetical protein